LKGALALATLSNSIFQLRRAYGSVAAIPLIAERESLPERLGEAAYQAAVAAAIEQLDRDYAQLYKTHNKTNLQALYYSSA
jgi:xanthine dehydrogenase iron-sulfur cluster and FAD-binding subunit A